MVPYTRHRPQLPQHQQRVENVRAHQHEERQEDGLVAERAAATCDESRGVRAEEEEQAEQLEELPEEEHERPLPKEEQREQGDGGCGHRSTEEQTKELLE